MSETHIYTKVRDNGETTIITLDEDGSPLSRKDIPVSGDYVYVPLFDDDATTYNADNLLQNGYALSIVEDEDIAIPVNESELDQ
jgi:hypothetical protein